ncbi:MAG: hypothetical protein WAM58_13875, partial [Candidatus Acidiferrum sp.]
FANVESLEEQASEHHVHTDVPDTAPEDEAPAIRTEKPQPATAPPATTAPPPTPTPATTPPTN